MFEADGKISLDYLRQIPWSDCKEAALAPRGDGLVVDEKVILR